MKFSPKFLKRSASNGAPDLLHQLCKKPQIMNRIQTSAQHFLDTEQMMQIGPGVTSADWAPAGRIDRLLVPRVARLFDNDTSKRCEQPTGATMTGGDDAVEHINPARHPFDEILRHAHTHEVAWLG